MTTADFEKRAQVVFDEWYSSTLELLEDTTKVKLVHVISTALADAYAMGRDSVPTAAVSDEELFSMVDELVNIECPMQSQSNFKLNWKHGFVRGYRAAEKARK